MNLHKMIALVLSPVTISLVASLGTYVLDPNPLNLLISIVLVTFCPIISVLRKSITGEIDILVPDRPSRGPFFMQAISCYFLASVIFIILGGRLWAMLSLSYAMVTTVVAYVNQKYTKVSVHMAGLAGPATFLIYINSSWLGCMLLALVPLLAWSRWKSGSHSIAQIALGILVSILVTLAICVLLSSI